MNFCVVVGTSGPLFCKLSMRADEANGSGLSWVFSRYSWPTWVSLTLIVDKQLFHWGSGKQCPILIKNYSGILKAKKRNDYSCKGLKLLWFKIKLQLMRLLFCKESISATADWLLMKHRTAFIQQPSPQLGWSARNYFAVMTADDNNVLTSSFMIPSISTESQACQRKV